MKAFLDPAKHAAAIIFTEGTTLLHAYYGPPEFELDTYPDAVLAEKPVVYPGGKVPPNDLIDVAIGLGLALRSLQAPYELVLPRTWKGTLQKKIMTERIKAKLTPQELAILKASGVTPSKLHNLLDCCGLWLYSLGGLQV